MSALYTLTALGSLFGVWLNIQGHRLCFNVWAVTNTVWTVADMHHGLPEQAALHAVNCWLALYGMWKWRHGIEVRSEPASDSAADTR